MFKKIPTIRMARQEWMKLRQTGIGGSDVGAICGANPYVSPLAIYKSKVEELPEIDEEKEAIRIGHDLEEYVARRFAEATGFKLRKSNYMYRSVEHPFMIADVDRLIIGEDAGLECKTVNAYGADNWKYGKIPIHYLLQCYHYMAVTGKRMWYIAALIMGRDFVYYRIDWDEQIIEGLIKTEERFWNDNVVVRMLPDPDGTVAYTETLNEYFKAIGDREILELNEGYDELIFKRDSIAEQIEGLTIEKNKIDQMIKLAMGSSEYARTPYHKVSWKNIETKRLDSTRLKEEQPDIYERYVNTSTSRRFEIKEREDMQVSRQKGDTNGTEERAGRNKSDSKTPGNKAA